MKRRVFLVTALALIDITCDEHILRNLDWCNPRIKVVYSR